MQRAESLAPSIAVSNARAQRLLAVYQEMVESLPVGVLGIDAEGMVVVSNRLAREVLAHADADFLGRSIEEVVPAGLRNVLALASPGRWGRMSALGGRPLEFYYRALGRGSNARGTLLVLRPVEEAEQ
jgi:PAS domain-containing protein